MRRPRRPYLMRAALGAGCALWLTACAESALPPSKNSPPDDMARADQDADDLPQTPEDMADMASQDQGDSGQNDQGDPDMSAPTGSYTLCVLQERGPWEASCDPVESLTFGLVASGQTSTRRLRISAGQGSALTLTRATLQDPELSTLALTYDRAQPPNATVEPLPLAVAPGQSAFVEVSWAPGLTPRALDGLTLTLELTLDGQPAQRILPLTGTASGCMALTLSCDGRPETGCETPINTLTNCGGCGVPCRLDFAAETCDQGQCVITQCEGGYKNCDGMDANGCEANLRTSLEHCGDCGQRCDFANATETCLNGQCTFGECDQGWADCDNNRLSNGCEVHIDSDPSHCGGCARDCARPGANVACQAGQCDFQGCRPGFYDLDGDPSNGCEYACTFLSATDLPDPMGIDANCDGIDGDAARALFVALDGSDNHVGTRQAPLRTLTKAIQIAQNTSGLDHVYVSAGRYREQIFIASGVSIYGGYQRAQGWARSTTHKSEIYWDTPSQGRLVAVEAINLQAPTTIDLMHITTADVLTDGISTYAMRCEGCNRLTLSNSVLRAGRAGQGVHGAPGQTGMARFGRGFDGSEGTQGDEDGSSRGQGGAGGASACGRTGGAGGQGGSRGRNQGEAGGTGVSGTMGGDGGAGGDPGRRGFDGDPGAAGALGAQGSGGSGGSISGGYFLGQHGSDGGDGAHGNGGGGGGGGGGQGCTLCINGSGNGGGGGGGGGCAGSAGKGGQAGGSSFGLFLFQSTGATLDNNVITSGDGGRGGDGGAGGAGSDGGNGGLGKIHRSSEIGAGGDGGPGGPGGDGGTGGGGAGGYSFAIYRASTTIGLPGNNLLNFASPGQGGGPAARAGGPGLAGPHNN